MISITQMEVWISEGLPVKGAILSDQAKSLDWRARQAEFITFKYDWIAVGSRGTVAWFAVTTTIEGVVNNEKKERVFNMSGALEKVKGKWRIVSLHFSRLGAEQQK